MGRECGGTIEALRTDGLRSCTFSSARGCSRWATSALMLMAVCGAWARLAVALSACGGLSDRRSLADTERPAAASSGGAACGGDSDGRVFSGRRRSSPLPRRTPNDAVACSV